MKIGFNEATALECKGQSLMADLEMCEKYGFDYIEIRFDCVKDYLKERQKEIREENTELMKQRFNKCFDTLFDMGVEHTQYVRDDIQVKAIDTFLKHYENSVLRQNNTDE